MTPVGVTSGENAAQRGRYIAEPELSEVRQQKS
jgi:hypothetical protein